jgi:hypothetical protein
VLAGAVAAVVALGGASTAAALTHATHGTPSVVGSDHDRKADDKADKGDKSDKGDNEHGKSGTHGSANAKKMVAIATAHREGMTQWHACVRAAATAGKANPTAGCQKPLPPGWVKHPAQHPAGSRPGSTSTPNH